MFIDKKCLVVRISRSWLGYVHFSQYTAQSTIIDMSREENSCQLFIRWRTKKEKKWLRWKILENLLANSYKKDSGRIFFSDLECWEVWGVKWNLMIANWVLPSLWIVHIWYRYEILQRKTAAVRFIEVK